MKESLLPSRPVLRRLESVGVRRLVLIACVLNLAALVLMIWSVLDPTPLPVMVVMSVGQALGTCGLACYLAAVFIYQWMRRKPSAEKQ